MKREKLLGKSLEELGEIRRKLDKEFGLLFVGGSLAMPILGLLSNNDTSVLVGGNIAILVPFILKFRETMDFIMNCDTYYCHSKEYQEAYASYQVLLEEIIKMFQSLGWDNEMKIFAGYSYLFKKGYLSLSHEFYYSKISSDVYYFLGSNIVLGEGNCRHINVMLGDLLRTGGYSTFSVGMNLDKPIIRLVDDLLRVRFYDMNDNVDEEECSLKKHKFWIYQVLERVILSQKGVSNHLVTLLSGEKGACLLDACNDTLFLVNDKGHVYQNGNIFVIDRRWRYNKFRNYGKKIKIEDLLIPTDRGIWDDISRDYYGVWNRCFDYHDTFERFYQEHRELYEEVLVKRRELKEAKDRSSIYGR